MQSLRPVRRVAELGSLGHHPTPVKRPNTPVFAVVRLDYSFADLSLSGGATPQAAVEVTVKEIVTTREAAEAEVERLNKLNGEKGCRYFWQQTRFVSDDTVA